MRCDASCFHARMQNQHAYPCMLHTRPQGQARPSIRWVHILAFIVALVTSVVLHLVYAVYLSTVWEAVLCVKALWECTRMQAVPTAVPTAVPAAVPPKQRLRRRAFTTRRQATMADLSVKKGRMRGTRRRHIARRHIVRRKAWRGLAWRMLLVILTAHMTEHASQHYVPPQPHEAAQPPLPSPAAPNDITTPHQHPPPAHPVDITTPATPVNVAPITHDDLATAVRVLHEADCAKAVPKQILLAALDVLHSAECAHTAEGDALQHSPPPPHPPPPPPAPPPPPPPPAPADDDPARRPAPAGAVPETQREKAAARQASKRARERYVPCLQHLGHTFDGSVHSHPLPPLLHPPQSRYRHNSRRGR
jgi:hypothetical protein